MQVVRSCRLKATVWTRFKSLADMSAGVVLDFGRRQRRTDCHRRNNDSGGLAGSILPQHQHVDALRRDRHRRIKAIENARGDGPSNTPVLRVSRASSAGD